MNWLSEELKLKIKQLFEPRYKRELSNTEVLEIASNLTEVVENIAKFKWKQKYEKPI